MELTTAARRLALADQTIRGYVTEHVWKDRLEEAVDGTGGAALVLASGGSWSSSPEDGTSEYPLLVVRAFSDVSRDRDGLPARADAVDRARALWRAANAIFHRPTRRGEMWGGPSGLLVMTSVLWSGPLVITNDDSHEVEGTAALGDAALVQAEYAIHCAP